MTAGGQQFIFDVQDGVAGYNTDPARGADTFHPFLAIKEEKKAYTLQMEGDGRGVYPVTFDTLQKIDGIRSIQIANNTGIGIFLIGITGNKINLTLRNMENVQRSNTYTITAFQFLD